MSDKTKATKMITAADIDYPLYLFGQGTNFRSYDFLGAHQQILDGVSYYTFRVYAPNALEVSLTGDFNSWSVTANPMKKHEPSGVWQTTAAIAEGELYKYSIKGRDGKRVLKRDPYGFDGETIEGTASLTYSFANKFAWTDSKYMNILKRKNRYSNPMNIYEINACSWKQKRVSNDPNTYEDTPDTYLTYRELADELVPYLSEMSYTHVELMPLTEFPYIGSWGYQVGGYYSPSARYGKPEDLMYFVNKCHDNGIGVIMDWVPAHFPKDAAGLYMFDGGPLYESPSLQKREMPEWGTHQFDFGRTQVQSFLISNALFWFDKYHFDGLRVDAVSSILYLDFGKRAGKWSPNTDGGNVNYDGLAFIRKLNSAVREFFPERSMIAEESTAWDKVTEPVEQGGLGFHYKWNMGWMNDTLKYMKADPVYRSSIHDKLTFSLFYAFNENFVLPISHDEVVHGKKSLLDKSPGSYEEKFASTKAFLGYMMSHPGKKLLFMGSELGQFLEWNYRRCIDFELMSYDSHRKFRDFVRDLNHIYVEQPALWSLERSWDGFKWLMADDRDNNIIAYMRRGKKGKSIICVINFSAVRRDGYFIGVPYKCAYETILNSDDVVYGGTSEDDKYLSAVDCEYSGFPYSLKLNLAPLSCIYIIRSIKK